MMTAIVQCPNAVCGRVSRLGDDPLGRIFRCPRCLTKLPTASASAADAGWTAIVGPPRLGGGRFGFRLGQPQRVNKANPTRPATLGQAWKSLALGVARFWSMGLIWMRHVHATMTTILILFWGPTTVVRC